MIQKKVVEKIRTHILCLIIYIYIFFFFCENRAVYEIRWEHTAQPERPQMTMWSTPIACWISKATNTRSEYVIHIAFQLQQWLHARASMSRCTNSASLVDLWFVWLYPKCVCGGSALFKANLAATHTHVQVPRHYDTKRIEANFTSRLHTAVVSYADGLCYLSRRWSLQKGKKKPLQWQLSYCSCQTQITWF